MERPLIGTSSVIQKRSGDKRPPYSKHSSDYIICAKIILEKKIVRVRKYRMEKFMS